MRKFWYFVWIVVICGGSLCGSTVSVEAKYITGFTAGCLAMAALRLAKDN